MARHRHTADRQLRGSLHAFGGRRTRYAALGIALVAGVPAGLAGVRALTPSGPASGTVRAVAVDDAYLLQAASTGAQRRAYLKFLLGDIPQNAQITRAELILHGQSALPGSLQVSGLQSTAWSSRTLDAANAPGAEAPAITAAVPRPGGTAVLDVTRLVRGAGVVGLTVAPRPGGSFRLVSRSGGAAAPQLRVSWRRVHIRDTSIVPRTLDDGGTVATGAPVIGSLPPVELPSPSPSDPPTESPSPSPSDSPSDPPSESPSPSPSESPSDPPSCSVSALLVPSCGVWWGMATIPKSGETSDQTFGELENEVGRPFDIYHSYYKDDQRFPSQTLINRAHEAGKHRLLLINWKPATDHTWAQVAAGAVDSRIDAEAAYLKSHFTDKFFLTIWHEPENDVDATPGSGKTASDYAAMFRHTVLRLRADGVTNAVTVITYEATPEWASKSWWPQLWPGSDVVDWMGEDAYTVGAGPIWGGDFKETMNRTDPQFPNWPGFYTWAQHIAPGKPIMIPEYGVQEVSSDPNHKPWFFNTEAQELAQLPAIKAVVYWQNPGQPDAFDSSAASLAAFRQLAQQAMVNPQGSFGERIA